MNDKETDGLRIEHTYHSPTPYQTARRRRRRTDPFPSSSRERNQESESRITMSGILWPVSLLLGSKTTKARRLSVGQFVKGKNGCIYKVVDLINARDRTLITTYHEIMGQESFLVAPWEPIETVKEGTSSGSLGNVSPDSGYGEASGSGSDGDDESIVTAVNRGREDEGQDGEDGQGMRMTVRRRATSDQARLDVRTPRRGNTLTRGVNTRRDISEVTTMARTYTRRSQGPGAFDGANSRDSSRPGDQKLGNEGNRSMLSTGGGQAERGRSRSSSSASTESYRGLWGLLQGFKAKMNDQDNVNEESGESSSETSDSKSSAGTSLGQASERETFVREWRVVERRRARDEDDLTSSFEWRF